MECEKIMNLVENTPNQTSKFRIKKWVEIKDAVRGTYNMMYTDAYIQQQPQTIEKI